MPSVVRSMLDSFVETSSDLIAVASTRESLLYVNPAGLKLIGADSSLSGLRAITDLFPPDDLAYAREVVLAEYERTGVFEGNFRLRNHRTQAPIATHLSIFELRDAETDERAIALVARDASASRRSDVRLRFLVDAGAALSQSLDYVETFERLAEIIVKSIATYCVIDVLVKTESGAKRIERVAAAHVDRKGRDFLETFAQFVPHLDQVANPVAGTVYDGSSSLVTEMDDAWIDRSTANSEHASALRLLKTRSFVTVPLISGGDVVGALSCALAEEATRRPIANVSYDAEDLFFVEELGRRAGASLFNARTYARERRIAEELQAASLPKALPQIDGMHIDADYRPGSAEATIGGDWYDAFALDDGRIAISVGDVVGHGLRAAITMTKLRQAMQAAAMVDADPDVMLRVANKTILVHDPDSHATALAGIIDVEDRTIRIACAGHPSPLLRASDGSVSELEVAGLPLGVSAGAQFKAATLEIPDGSMLLTFTDGLVEATRDITLGYRRLEAAMSDDDVYLAHSAARAIVDRVLGDGNARDDVAALAIRLNVRISSPA